MIPYPQGAGCPDHPGPLVHWSQRHESCWACDIRSVYEGSTAHEEWLAAQMDGEQFRLPLVAA
jgi:hypothetical protein